MTQSNGSENPLSKRRRLLFPHGFQLRYVLLVAGSLIVLLLFTGLHGLFVAQLVLPADVSAQVRPIFASSTLRIFAIGILYIGVVSLGAVFLSHRAVGPIGRLEKEIRDLNEASHEDTSLKIRDGDELYGLAQAINELIEKKKKGAV